MLDLAKSKALGRPTCSRNVASTNSISPTSLEIPNCLRSDRACLTHASANFEKQWATVTINIFEQRISASNQRDLITTMGVYNIKASAMHITFKHAAAMDCPRAQPQIANVCNEPLKGRLRILVAGRGPPLLGRRRRRGGLAGQ